MRSVPFLVAGMFVTGCANSLITKYQDMQCVRYAPDGSCESTYNQPVFQTIVMCFGEACCLLVFKIFALKYFTPLKPHSVPENAHDPPYASIAPQPAPIADALDPDVVESDQSNNKLSRNGAWYFWFPAAFDIIATTLMNVGLFFTPVSVYQMTRGALVLWVGFFSVIFLKRRLSLSRWISLIIVMCGVMVVGMAGSHNSSEVDEEETAHGASVVLGVLLILFAQIFAACQFVVEEYIFEWYAVEPLRAVGLEGIFGLCTTLAIVPILYISIGRTDAGQGGYFDAVDGLRQMRIPAVFISSIATATSIGFFNVFGMAVTRRLSATSRSTIDTCRTLGIWLVSLLLGWESFRFMQLVGFGLLVYGTFVFNEVVTFPFERTKGKDETEAESEEQRALLA